MKTLLISIFCLGLVQPALPARVQPAREYILILEDTPLARQFHARTELRSAAALSHGARIGQAQQRVRNALAGRSDIRVVGSVRTLLNAVFVRASEKNLPELRSLAGVKYVVPSKRFKLHLNTALPLVRAQQAWAALNSAGYPNPGEGIKIGIIDTGIDQTHPALQDSSLTVPGGFPKCAGAECAYTSNKVIVAHSYVYLSAQGSDPQNRAADDTPDDLSPRDRVGHGTAAAVIAAGMETKAPLATISGVAPKAFLGNYKVFGSPGVNDGASSSAIITALDDALNEGMDIATMSLGFPAWYGPEDTGADCGAAAGAPCEAEAQAVDAAGQQGMIVVVSAGNDGDAGAFVPTLSTIHTPGIAPSAITVGASRNGHEFYSQVSASGPGAPDNVKNLAALFGGGPVPSEPLTAPLVDIKGLGCASVPSSVSGAIALVQRGSCDFSVKVANAQQAGAVGVIFYCNNTQYCSDGGEIPFVPGGLSATSIPAVVVGMTSGKNLAAYADAHSNNAQATLNPGLKEYVDPNANNIAEFSSRGPSIAPETALKPELVAVGTNVYTGAQDYDTNGAVYDKSRYAVMDGTSFSVPMVAGAAALVWQRNPSFSAAQVKSALVNTASTDITENGGTASILTVGAGKLNAESAVKTSVTVVPSTVTFGAVPAGGLLGPNAQRILRITNPTSSTLTLAVQANADANRLSLSRTSVGQHTTADVTVTFKSGEPAAGSYTGVITVTGGPVPLRVPYFYAKGDGVPDNMIPLTNSSFDGTVNSLIPGWATLVRVIDRYGLAVPNEPVTWETDGGASISNDPNCSGADAQTDIHGIAGACVMLGSQPDTFQDIFATVGSGTGQITYQFEGFPRAKPAITVNPPGVVNNASWQAKNGSSSALAPGSYISIFGSNLSDFSAHFGDYLPPKYLYLPVSLAGVSVSFDSGSVSVPGHLSYAGPDQVDVQVPWELQGHSTAQMKITLGDSRSNVYQLTLADAAPGIYEADSTNSYAAAQREDYSAITPNHPAMRGEWILIYADGLGPVSNQPSSGEPSPSSPLAEITKPITVTIGGKQVTEMNFAGLTPDSIGLYQVNVKVPQDAPTGLVNVVITVAGNTSKTAKITVQ